MPSISSNMVDATTLLRTLSIEVYKAANHGHYLAEMLNDISMEGRESLHLKYRNYSDNVNGLRNDVITQLLQEPVSYEILEQLVNKAKSKNPIAFKRIYTTWYSIFYPFLLEDKITKMNAAINYLVAYLEEKLNASSILKVKIVDFTGSRNNGATRCWVAFYNATHKNQATAKQLFLEIENGTLSYSFYDRPNSRKQVEKTIPINENINIEDVASFFKQFLPEILQNNIESAEKGILILQPETSVYKFSMGQEHFSDEDFKALLERGTIVMHEETNPMGRTSISQSEYFSGMMKEGDYVYVCHGNKKVSALGKIISGIGPCEYKNWGEDNWMQRKLEIIRYANKEEPYYGPQKWWTPNNRSTCYPIGQEETNLANEYLFEPIFNLTLERLSLKKMNNKNTDYKFPVNTILYGPPGTGKTYNTITYALSIIEERPFKELDEESKRSRKEILDRFEFYKSSGQIEFITFHQSYSYEEFIQGIRPQINASQLQFEKKDGLFKRFAEEALRNLETSNGSEINIAPSFDELFDDFFKPLIDETGEITIPMESPGYSFRLTRYNPEQKNIPFVKRSGGDSHSLYIPTIKQFFDNPELNQGLKSYYKPLAKKLRERANEMTSISTPREKKNYVLVIDEINRANISKIFGELITLIENDKRWGNSEATKVILPSGDEFTVPKNLFIIGTMNTADRSIALIDLALRRRFQFIPIYPVYDTSQWWGNLLRSINEAIFEKRGNPDFFIGHAFFINKQESEKAEILRNMVLPLLNEYFQDNGKSAVQILQKAGVACKKGGIDENFQLIIDL